MSMPFVLTMLALLVAGAWRDIATRTIPDSVSLLLLAAGGLARLLNGPPALALSVGAAILLFIVLSAAFARGLIGGGDVKVMTALAVGLSPLDCYRFVFATAIAGGLLATAYLLLSYTRRPTRATPPMSLLGRIFKIESWRIRHRGPLPYGVAIAAGGAFVLLHPGSL